MKYLEMKKRAFLSIAGKVKGFVKTISSALPLTLYDCVSNTNLLTYTLYGESYQKSQPTPDTPVEVESVGDLVEDTTDINYGKYKIPVKISGKNSDTVTNIYLDAPLRKFKDYADYIDFENGIVKRYIKERILTGNETVSLHANGHFIIYLSGYIYSGNTSGSVAGYMNYFPNNVGYGDVYYGNALGFGFSKSQLRIYFPEITTKADFVSWLKQKYNEGKPVKVYGILASPTEEEITLPKIPTFKGTTTYSVDTKIKPSNLSATYYSSMKGE